MTASGPPSTDEGRLESVEADLRRERERLAVVLQAGPMGVYEWTIGTNDVWWSPELYTLYGVDPEHFFPSPESLSALLHPDDRAELWRKTQDCIERGAVFVHEYRIVRPDGEQRWIYNRSRVSPDAEGRPGTLTGVALDITERRRSEDALIEADRRKDRFIATLAHELRNPLAPIRNAVRLLSRDEGAARATWAREVIERQVTHMARLLDDLLDISRISRDLVELQTRATTVGAIVDLAVETSQPAIERAGHAFELVLPQEPLRIETDPVRLAQVLANLLNNAAKYTEPGGHIRLVAEREVDEIVFRVADDGIGIAPELQAFVFDIFSRARTGGDLSQGGLGIGLSLARGLVTAMGGRIEVRSEGVGRGSEFTVRLPLSSSPQAGALPAQASTCSLRGQAEASTTAR